VPVGEVNSLLKQYEMMAPIMKSIAGKSMFGRMQAVQDIQKKMMADPGGKMLGKPKGDTGKRLTSKERAEMKKRREKELRRKQREMKAGKDRRQE
jgi:hypothetical protein